MYITNVLTVFLLELRLLAKLLGGAASLLEPAESFALSDVP
jgi:hypothetical protein